MSDAPDSAQIEAWMKQEIAKAQGVFVDEIDAEVPFDELGLDSVTALEVIGALEQRLGRTLSPRLLTKHRTVRALSTFLASP